MAKRVRIIEPIITGILVGAIWPSVAPYVFANDQALHRGLRTGAVEILGSAVLGGAAGGAPGIFLGVSSALITSATLNQMRLGNPDPLAGAKLVATRFAGLLGVQCQVGEPTWPVIEGVMR